MATLPLLKSGQTVQYPLRRALKQAVETVAFLDGSEQRCATSRPLHEWTLQLALIDEQELSALETFVEQQQGETGQFVFTDPQDGIQYNNCSLAVEVFQETFQSPGRIMTRLLIRENPNQYVDLSTALDGCLYTIPNLQTALAAEYPVCNGRRDDHSAG